MGTITAEHGTVKYVVKGATYFVEENFAPSVQVFKEAPSRRWRGIPETFFSNGPVEKLVSILGLGTLQYGIGQARFRHGLNARGSRRA